jgi:hypothetical protein
MTKYVCFVGRARTGKTYLAEQLRFFYQNRSIHVLPIASELKRIYVKKRGIHMSAVEMPGIKEKHRQGLIDLGAQMRRDHGNDVFVKAIRRCCEYYSGLVLIPDMRFVHESEAFGDALRIRVNASEATWIERFGGEGGYRDYLLKFAHDPSEMESQNIPVDLEVWNDGETVEPLARIVDAIERKWPGWKGTL